jgi:hypothetical protein
LTAIPTTNCDGRVYKLRKWEFEPVTAAERRGFLETKSRGS